MRTAIAPQSVDVVDVFSAQRHLSCGVTQQLDDCHLERWGLSLECPTPEDPAHAGEITWLLPEAGLRVTQYRPRSRHARRDSVLITAVRIERDTRSWTTTDLLLGLEVPERGAPRVTQPHDFAAAVHRGTIHLSEADHALRSVHRTFQELHPDRDVSRWLAHQGVVDSR